jgi:Ribonuclease HepT-like
MKLEAKKLLFDVITACRDIVQFTAGKTFGDYLVSELLRSAVERKFGIIGEALVRLRAKDSDTFDRINAVRMQSLFETDSCTATMQLIIKLFGRLLKTTCQTSRSRPNNCLATPLNLEGYQFSIFAARLHGERREGRYGKSSMSEGKFLTRVWGGPVHLIAPKRGKSSC